MQVGREVYKEGSGREGVDFLPIFVESMRRYGLIDDLHILMELLIVILLTDILGFISGRAGYETVDLIEELTEETPSVFMSEEITYLMLRD